MTSPQTTALPLKAKSAEEFAEEIAEDLRDRRGIKHYFDKYSNSTVDAKTKEEIYSVWREIIKQAMTQARNEALQECEDICDSNRFLTNKDASMKIRDEIRALKEKL